MSTFPSIAEETPTLERHLRREGEPLRKQRLHLLVLITTGAVSTQAEAARHLALHRNTIRRYLQKYRTGGLEALLEVGAAGQPPGQRLLPPKVFEALKARLDAHGFASYTEAHRWVEERFDLEVNYKSLHKLIRYRLGAKLKRSRPRHRKRMRPKPLSS